MRTQRRGRRAVVVRKGRQYVVCGLGRPLRPSPLRMVVSAVAAWIPFSALVLLVLVSACAIEWPPTQRAPNQRVAVHSMEDFFYAYRR